MATRATSLRPARPFPFWPTLGWALLVACTGMVAAILAGIPTVIIAGSPKNPGDVAMNVIEAAFYLGGAAVLVPALERLSGLSLPQLGLRRLEPRAWGLIVFGAVAVFALQFCYQFVLIALHQQNHVQAGFEKFAVHSPLAATMVLINGAAIAPFCEELFFRGLLFNALSVRMPVLFAAILSGIVFGGAHGDPVLLPVLALFGVLQALLYRATGNLYVPIAVHAINNGVFLALMIAFPGFH